MCSKNKMTSTRFTEPLIRVREVLLGCAYVPEYYYFEYIVVSPKRNSLICCQNVESLKSTNV